MGVSGLPELNGNSISVFAPSDSGPGPVDLDFDDDGILNVNDPFIRDASNGGLVLTPGETLLWDFDADQDNNQPGPGGYGGGTNRSNDRWRHRLRTVFSRTLNITGSNS